MFPSSAVIPEHSRTIQRDISMEPTHTSETVTLPMPRTPPDAFAKHSIAIARDDLAVLDILTGNRSDHEHGHIESHSHTLAVESRSATNTNKKNTKFARRDADLDPLLIAAAFASGPHVTRHHYHHNFNPAEDWTRWGSDGGDSSTDTEDNAAKTRPRYISGQAPRSERIRLQREQHRTLTVDADTPSLSPDLPPSEASASNSDDSEDDKSSIPSLSLSTPETTTSSLSSSPALAPLQLKPDTLSLVSSFPEPSTAGEVLVKCMVRTRVPTPHGEVFLHLYHNNRDNKEHLAIVIDPAQLAHEGGTAANSNNGLHAPFIRSKTLDAVWSESETPMERIIRGAYVGRLNEHRCVVSKPEDANVAATQHADSDLDSNLNLAALIPPPLVRIHSECFTGETIGSMRCDCGEQLDEAIRRIAEPTTVQILATPAKPAHTHTLPGRGAVIYMRQEGRGIGLLSKLRAYNLQDLGHDTVAANLLLGFGADERGYDVAAAIMRDLGLDDGVRLLTNNPDKVMAMEREGMVVRERVEMVPRSWKWKCQSESVDEDGLSRSRLHSNGNSAYGDHDHAHPHEGGAGDDERNARLRSAGATLIGASATHGPELEKYLRTKVLRMGHMLSLPTS